MPTYRFQALNAKGATISGTLQAAGEREAARALDERGLAVIALDPATGSASAGGRRQRASRLRAQDLIVAFHELATMLQSGVALAEAVASQARSAHHPRIVAAFSTISTALRRGQSFSDALAGTDLPLPGYFGILVRAGEQSGLLAQALADGVAQLE
jgi:general secretion pathway protein F